MYCKPCSNLFRALPVLVLGAVLALQGCKSDPAEPAGAAAPTKTSVDLSGEYTSTTDVVSVDHAARTVTLRREDGSLFTLQVGQAARNFDQIAAGDKVRVRYEERLTASLRPAGDTAQPATGAVAADRTAAGEKPGGAVGVAVTVRVKIESIDLERDIVVFSLASGELVAHRVSTSAGREFVKGLKLGDVVQLDYSQGLALSVEEL